jgi:deoxyribodipyrimidine photolyase-related protein
MKRVAIIFPHQLFEDHPALSLTKDVCIVEDERFFTDFRFHKKKLLFHRASMLAYKKLLVARGYRVRYIKQGTPHIKSYLDRLLEAKSLEELCIVDPCAHKLMSRLQQACEKYSKRLHILDSPAFLTSKEALEHFFAGRKTFSMSSFYIRQRKEFGILTSNGKPAGGKWSFDPENRKKLPRNVTIPEPKMPRKAPSKLSASQIEEEYSGNPGVLDDFIFPVTHRGARDWLTDFIENRLKLFGDYEDSISADSVFLFHSVLSPLLNAGLLSPKQVLDEVLAGAERNKIPMNSLEGFVRQIIGWREFVRGAYIFIGSKQRKSNFWNCSNELPESFYSGTTGIQPVDAIVKRVMKHSYCHHIERLMILGNFMLLCEMHPDEAYRWFMELFIDAYDWVMVPNVYGMSQYADGGLMTSKPYISSSNYIRKMSDFKAGPWCDIWDSLFWRFIHKHKAVFEENPRMRVMTFQLRRMGTGKIEEHVQVAERFLEQILG